MRQKRASDTSVHFVLYGDFNCPFCYTMHERLHAQGVMERVEWRGVQHAPHLPIPMARWHGRFMEELRHEVATIGRLAPTLPISLPNGKPNTKPAIELSAHILTTDPAQGRILVRRLYQLFWCDGRDISDSGVLGETLHALGIDPPENKDMRSHVLDDWDEQWRETGQAGVPILVRRDGSLLVGLAGGADLDRFVKDAF